MQHHSLRPARGSRNQAKRVGRGLGSGRGTFATRGVKGQRARAGKTIKPGFEGGQTPLYKRMPKLRGFRPIAPTNYQVVNLSQLEKLNSTTIDKATLKESGLIHSTARPVKLLGNGDAPKGLTVTVDAVSGSAEKKITEAGGTVEVLKDKKTK